MTKATTSAPSRVDEIVRGMISECERKGIPYSIGNLYEDAEIQFAEELAEDE